MTDLQLELETLIQSKPIESTETKVCAKCGEVKPLTDYYKRLEYGPDALYSKWKSCYIKIQLQRSKHNKNRKTAPPQPKNCDCCGTLLTQTVCYDHDHETGRFRGWLCHNCNSGIGKLGDDLEGVLKAVTYLTTNLWKF